MNVKERLKEFIKYKNYSVRRFETEIGLSHGYVNNIRVSIQPDKLISIALRFPDLNLNWLFTGNGKMLNNINTVSDSVSVYERSNVEKRSNIYKPNSLSETAKSSLIRSIERITATAERNSKSQEKMVETADRNSKTLAILAEYLINNKSTNPNDMHIIKDANKQDEN